MDEIIRIENLTVTYDNMNVLDDVSFTINENDFVGIIGPNGGGKSTLLKAILGLIKIDSGKILIYGQELKKNKNIIGYVPQFSLVDKKFPISVIDVVLSAMINIKVRPFYRFNEDMKQEAYKCLDKVGIKDLADRQISELSGGEFQRLLIARALAVKPKILFLDEPTASVDTVSMKNIYDLLEEINKDTTIVLVTHDLMTISTKVNKIACLNKKLVYHGEPQIDNNTLDHLYGCPVDLIAHGVPHRVLDEHKEAK